ncbi:extracellular solute-binding protein [Thermanaerosceptrum fracticalcis]|uniref:Extracellular solute-binding protein n=1 Tax=Thermanaerosceptrum fracticalcis TaxID=1712410 RepID=A0A7G6E1S6_THEFR|nr:TRAP transporter substrate-binding protein [Thermanaerosceptrum fracticalcis]QNB46030.1 extracellular solute-binding protein [Thermanaerosceptrum fracticalcis]
MKKLISILLIFCMATLLFTGCSGQKPADSKPPEEKTNEVKPIVLRFADTEVPGMPEYEGNLYFIKLVEERTKGKVKIEYYHSNQMGNDKQITAAAMAGTLDIVKCAAGNFSEFSKALSFTDLPGLFKNAEHMRKVWKSDIREQVTSQIKKDTGLTPVMFDIDGGAARALFYNKKPITVPADIKGMKFRTTGSPIEVSLFKEWGVAATPMNFNELYTSLQQGVVDGMYGHPIGTYYNKLCEVTKYCTIVDISYITTLKLLSKSAVEKLGGENSELYNIVIQAGKEAELEKDKLISNKNKEIEDLITKAGVKIIKPNSDQIKLWREAAQKVWSEYVGSGKLISEELVKKVQELEKQ